MSLSLALLVLSSCFSLINMLSYVPPKVTLPQKCCSSCLYTLFSLREMHLDALATGRSARRTISAERFQQRQGYVLQYTLSRRHHLYSRHKEKYYCDIYNMNIQHESIKRT